jgi:hypothetical protein
VKKILLSLTSMLTLFCTTAPLLATDDNIQITIDDTTFIEQKDAGTYPITYQYRNESGQIVAEEVHYITLTYQRTIINRTDQEGIDAHDIIIQKNYFAKITDADLITLTNARAWRTTDGSTVAISTVERSNPRTPTGSYTVTFKTALGTETTINVIEQEVLIIPDNTVFFDTTELPSQNFQLLSLLVIFTSVPLILLLAYFTMQKEIKTANKLLYISRQKMNKYKIQ